MESEREQTFVTKRTLNQVKDNSLDEFLQDLKPGQMAIEMFSVLPEIMFWIKDQNSRLIFCNGAYAEATGKSIDDIIGKSDEELFAPELAQVFMDDDDQVVNSGDSIRNKLELVPQGRAGVQWRQTSKMALLDKNNKVKGTVGISRVLMNGKKLPAPYRTVEDLVEYVEANINKQITVKSLCEHFVVSQSTLERRFKEFLGCSPKKFVMKAKMTAACKLLLDSPMTIGEVAANLGYGNQASFTRSFVAEIHMTPSKYRSENGV